MSDYLQANSLSSIKVRPSLDDSESNQELALTIAEAASDRKGGEIVILKVSEISYLADYFILVTGYSKAQVRAIAGAIDDTVEQKWQRRPLRIEGQAEGNWVLLDYGDAIVHIMMPKEREFYNLEAFWSHAEKLEFSADGENEA